tara:strand:+ start:21 stop:923 length:903 start_codon:yes stop_codon:yes gene_type:complete
MATINLGSIKFNWKGAFNNSTAYAVDDVVSSGGNSYVCIQASQGNAVGNATAYWNIMSSAGAAGAEGGTSTLTTRGDLLTRGASAVARLAKGTAGQVLGQGANDPAWVNGSSSTLTTQGDLLYRDGSGLQRLAKGTAAQELRMNSSANAPEWYTPVAGGNTPGFMVKLGSQQTGISDNTWTKINLASEVYDSDNKFASYKFTPTVAGYYYIFGAVLCQAYSDGGRSASSSIYLNGSAHFYNHGRDHGAEFSASSAGVSSFVDGIINMDTNDYVELYTKINVASQAAAASQDYTYMGGFKI